MGREGWVAVAWVEVFLGRGDWVELGERKVAERGAEGEFGGGK